MQAVINVKNGVPRHPSYRMKEPVNFTMNVGEQIAFVGPNGGGKSLLVDILMGRWPLLQNEVNYDFSSSHSKLVCDNIKCMAFRDSYGDADANYYYQQRFNWCAIYCRKRMTRNISMSCSDCLAWNRSWTRMW